MNPKERAAVEQITQEVVAAEGLDLLKLRIGNDRHLMITIDRDDAPITLADCTRVNRRLREALEASDAPADDYAIDVESPGTDRELTREKDFRRFIGERVRVKLGVPSPDGTSVVRGSLEGLEEGLVVIKPLTGPRFRLKLSEIAEARLDPRY
ncbi:MAG TPA: hypothetical protein PKA37_11175 [Planctomycetota bacterium]|mgnify:CR=1 FL=1|jgi:ribosome maturation factor RimP|nr:hypothetical protein [Planctomycetota bacterium]